MKVLDLFKLGDNVIITYKKDEMYNKEGIIIGIGDYPFPIKVNFENKESGYSDGYGFYNPDMLYCENANQRIKNIKDYGHE